MKRKRSRRSRTPASERGVLKVVAIAFAGIMAATAIGLTLFAPPPKKAGDTPAPSDSGSPTTSGSPVPAASPGSSAAPVSKDPVLDVKELGVKFKLPSGMNDLKYAVDGSSTVAFGLNRLDGVSGCTIDQAPLGYLSTDANQGGKVVAIVSKREYYYIQPNSGCTSPLPQELAPALRDALSEMTSR